uniref:Uncharacterized protein n=1 Tax=Timema tahoe TaxID=61484 RepID=A0A7R9FNG6_9NEOP|nr:unnamed protein product [Timema tahoe]
MALKWRPTNISHVVDDDADKLFKMELLIESSCGSPNQTGPPGDILAAQSTTAFHPANSVWSQFERSV